jgi:hypothetical protein
MSSPGRPDIETDTGVDTEVEALARVRTEDDRIFGRALAIATRGALIGAAVVFVLLSLEVLDARVPLAEMPAHWGRDARAWREVLAGATISWPALASWPWPARSPGELAGGIAIAALCLAPVPALVALALRLARRGDALFAALAAAHIALIALTLAAVLA